MTRTRRMITIALCAAVTASAVIPDFIRASDPASQPATQKAAGRDIQVINNELKAEGAKFLELVPNNRAFADAAFRKDNAEKLIPELQHIAKLLNEIATTYDEPSALEGRNRFLSMAVAMGDKDSTKTLTDESGSKDPKVAIPAKTSLILGNWIANSQDAKAQTKILDDYTDFAKANPKEDRLADTLMIMSQLGPANDQLAKRAKGIIESTLTGDTAQQIIAQTAALDKPIVIAGRTTTDGKFNSNTLKGKVILVDFWGTWCGPCRESMPKLKKLYETYHDKGLEIVGVDSDPADDKVNSFTKEAGLPWPQLREQTQTDANYIHPINTKYGIDIFPTTYIIDKKGILRHMENPEAPGDVEGIIQKLLAEDTKEAKPAKPASAVQPPTSKKE